jgi:hypothetical protein
LSLSQKPLNRRWHASNPLQLHGQMVSFTIFCDSISFVGFAKTAQPTPARLSLFLVRCPRRGRVKPSAMGREEARSKKNLLP